MKLVEGYLLIASLLSNGEVEYYFNDKYKNFVAVSHNVTTIECNGKCSVYLIETGTLICDVHNKCVQIEKDRQQLWMKSVVETSQPKNCAVHAAKK